jgi:glucokinase
MILGIDVGGTKTLLGAFDSTGKLERTHRSLTSANYDDFLNTLAQDVRNFTAGENISSISIAMPGSIDRTANKVISMGHRPWKNIDVANDLKHKLSFDGAVHIENDAKLAGLGEAQTYKEYSTVVYITISTGIGTALIVDRRLDPHFVNSEGGFMLIADEGKLTAWDTAASGAAFQRRYGHLASEVNDPHIWKEYSKLLAPGFSAIIALINPDVIITGGGLGVQLEKYQAPLTQILDSVSSPIQKLPVFKPAQYGENSVLYGCYTLANQHAATSSTQ